MQPTRSVILVVDDDAAIRETLYELLAQDGYTVESAVDGEAGLRRVAAGQVDLVLLDLVLPKLDGVALCREIRARPPDAAYLPIVMLTAHAGEAARHAGFAAGADDYVAKPFKSDDLLDRVRVWVQTRRRLQAAHERLLAANAQEQRLLRETEARSRSFRALHEVAVAVSGVLDPEALARLVTDHARDLLSVDSASLWWWDAEAGVLRRLAGHIHQPDYQPVAFQPGEGSAGQAFVQGAPVIVHDYPAWEHALDWGHELHLQAAAAVPVLVGERAIGALSVYSFTAHQFTADEVQLLGLLAAQVGPALEAARLYAESERRRAEAEALAELARHAAVAPDPGRVIDAITEQACRLLQADYATVALTQPDGTYAWAGLKGSRTDAWVSPPGRLSQGRGTCGRAIAAGRTVILERLGDNPDLSWDEFPRHRAEGGRTALGAPLFGRRGAFGALVLGWRRDVRLTPAQVRLAEALGSYAATILDNARAHAEVATEVEKLRRLAEVAAAMTAEADLGTVLDRLVQAAAEAVGLEHNSLLLLDAERGMLSHAAAVGLPSDYLQAVDGLMIGPDVGTCGAAAFRGETVITQDVLADPHWAPYRALVAPYGFRAVWSVPLVGKAGRVLGTFAAYRRHPGRPSTQQLELLTLYARLATMAVENARSYAREEQLAREATARAADLATLFEQLPCGVAVVDAAGKLQRTNEAVRRIWGCPSTEPRSLAERVIAYQVRDPLTGRQLAPEETVIARALASGAVQAQEYLLRRPGETADTWVQASAAPLRDADGRVTAAVGVFSDVTRERQLVRDLARSEARLRTLYQAMACGVMVRDASGAIVDANEAAEEIFGVSLAELRGRTPEALWPAMREDESDLSGAERPSDTALRTGDALRQVTISFQRPNGERRWLQNDAVPVRGPDGALLQVVSSFIDITDRKHAEEEWARLAGEIEQERATLAAIVGSMSDGLVFLDANGRVQYYNERAAALVGASLQPLLGQGAEAAFALVQQCFADPTAAWATYELGSAQAERQPCFELRVVGPPPRELLVQFFAVASLSESGRGVGILLRDVTDTKLLALLQERERIAMDLHDGVIQSLYAVALGLGARARALDGNTETTREALRKAVAHINAVIQEVRNYIFDLRLGEQAARGVRAGLDGLAAELRINTLIHPELAVDPAADVLLPPDAAANLLQIAREATANVIRHAGATAVQITLAQEGEGLVLTVRDNGRGFDPASEEHDGPVGGGGQGLHNMAERARLLGGRLTVRSEPGQGTTVRLTLPLGETRGNGWPTGR